MAARLRDFRNLTWKTHVIVLLVVIIDSFRGLHSQTTDSVTSSTDTATVTVVTTTPAPTTTPMQVQTTPAASSAPQTAFPSNTDLGPCPCDLTGNSCDVNCCCDQDCSDNDRLTFSFCLQNSYISKTDDRVCFQQNLIIIENTPVETNTTEDGLFCIYYDNYAQRNYYNIPDILTSDDTERLELYVNRYAGPSFKPTSRPDPRNFKDIYKSGDQIYTVFETSSLGVLALPSSLHSTQCQDNNPAAYLYGKSSSCIRDLGDLAVSCQTTPAIQASTFYTGFKVVRTPSLFAKYVAPNSTSDNKTDAEAPTNTTGPSQEANLIVTVLPPTMPNPQLPSAPTNSTPAPTTTPVPATITSNGTTTDATINSTDASNSTDAPVNATAPTPTISVVTPNETTFTTSTAFTLPEYNPEYCDIVQVDDLFNNSCVAEVIPQSPHLCITSPGGIPVFCNYTDLPVPLYDPVTRQCSNVVSQVEYIITTNGSKGIYSVEVKFVLTTLLQSDLPLSQTFISKYQGRTETNPEYRSGNPGYVVGEPVLAGQVVRQTDTITGTVLLAVQLNSSLTEENSLTVLKPSVSGDCTTDTQGRSNVLFGEDMRAGCFISFNVSDMRSSCQRMQEIALLSLWPYGPDPPRNWSVATFGNSDPQVVGDWASILVQNSPRGAVSGTGAECVDMVLGAHIQILYANVGSLSNPQPKIVGASFIYESPQTIAFQCSGSFCQPGREDAIQRFEVVQSVSFVDVSEPAAEIYSEPPLFLAKVPYDFFYPFALGSGNLCKPYLSLVTISSVIVILFVRQISRERYS